jgi:hypothetical protein
MKKALLAGLLFIAAAVEASTVAWIDGAGYPIHIWTIRDGSNTLWAFQSYYACMQQVAILEARRARSK